MLKSKKTIIIAIVVALVLVGTVTGVAFAQTGGAGTTPGSTLLSKVAKKLGIDQQKLETAFAEARKEMQEERLQELVKQGKITQEQLNQYKQWLQSRPDTKAYQDQLKKWQESKPGIPPDLKKWQESRPNVPIPGPFGGPGRGFFFPGQKPTPSSFQPVPRSGTI